MIGKLIREVAEGVGEAVVSPLTIANATVKAASREFDKVVNPKPDKPAR